MAFLLMLAPSAPFAKELGVFESSAVRDIFAGHVILPSFGALAPGSQIQAPPLSWWTDALVVGIVGWNEIAFRLPEMVASAATCAILFFWLAQVAGYRAGFWAAASLLFCRFFADAARQPRMDAMLATFVTASAICLERALLAASQRRRQLLFLAAILMAFATMTKGPLGLVLPGITIGAYCLVTRRLRELFTPGIVAAFLGAAVSVMPWYVAAYRIGGQAFLEWQIYGVLFHRFLSSEIAGHQYCPNPFYYFIPIALAGYLPWSFYLPALGAWLWRRPSPVADAATFALCWFAAIFLFFSASTGKCFIYILPALPPLAAMFGLMVEKMHEPDCDAVVTHTFRWGSAGLGVGGLLLAALAVVATFGGPPLKILPHLHPKDREYIALLSSLAGRSAFAAFILTSGVGAVLLLAGSRRASLRLQLDGAIITAVATIAFWFGVMNPGLSRHQSLKSFAEEVDGLVPADAQIDYIGQMDYDFAFYSSHKVGRARDFECARPENRQHYFVVYQDRYIKPDLSQAQCVRLIARSEGVDRHGARLLFVTRDDRL